jgi:hypothetical protein
LRGLVIGVDAVHDLHQGGFARAVFAEQAVDFAHAHVEADVIQGGHAGEMLCDSLHLENNRVVGG